MRPVKFLLSPFFAINRLKNIELFFDRLELAMLKFMLIAAPAVFFVCTVILVKAALQSLLGYKNQEKKLTFGAALIWGFFGVLSLGLYQQVAFSKMAVILSAVFSLSFAVFLPSAIGLGYLFNLIFCCEESCCSRQTFSLHPSLGIIMLMSVYLIFMWGWLLSCLHQQKLLHSEGKRSSRLISGPVRQGLPPTSNGNFIVNKLRKKPSTEVDSKA